MKKSLSLILILALALCCAACGQSAQPAQTPDASESPAAGSVPDTADAQTGIPDSVRQILTDAPVTVPDFDAVDTEGSTVTQDFFSDKKLTMINFWEPWCGPCVGEMPDLQKLYENYSGEGFAILGVYSTEDGVADVLASCGTTYTVVGYVSEFDAFQTGYVPTTVFVNSQGETLTVPFAGSKSYDDWAELVEYFLQ